MTRRFVNPNRSARRRLGRLSTSLTSAIVACCFPLAFAGCGDASSSPSTTTSHENSAETIAQVVSLIPAIFSASSDPKAATEALVKLADLQPQTPQIIRAQTIGYRPPESFSGDYVYILGGAEFIINTATARAWTEIINNNFAKDHPQENAIQIYDTLDAILAAAMQTSTSFTIKYPGIPLKKPTPHHDPFVMLALLRAAILDKMSELGESAITPEHQQRIDALREIFNKREITDDIP